MLQLIKPSERERRWIRDCACFLVFSTISFFGYEGDHPKGPLTFWLAPVWLWAGPMGLAKFFFACALGCLVRYYVGPKPRKSLWK